MSGVEINCNTHKPVPGFSPYSVDGPQHHVVFSTITAPVDQVGNYVVIRPANPDLDIGHDPNRVIDPSIVIRVRESNPNNFMGGGANLGGGYMLKTWENIVGAGERPKIHHYHLTFFPKLDPGIDSQLGEVLGDALASAKSILNRLPFGLEREDIGEMAKQGKTQLMDYLSKELVRIEVSPHGLVIVISDQPLISVSEGEITVNESFFRGRYIENTNGRWLSNNRYRSILSGSNQLLELNVHEIPLPKRTLQIVTGFNFPEFNYYGIVLPISGMIERGEINEDKLRDILNPYISIK